MNFQNMEYFMMAAETGNITRAAERLHISQQALSDCISRLESELGCRLFERRQGLELTYSGRQYRAAVERMLDLHKQTVVMLNDINGNIRGELRIGISYTRGQAILPLVLPEFISQFPLVELSVQEGSTQMLESLLEHGEIDVMIGFAPFRIDRAESFPLMRDRLHLVIPKSLLRNHWKTANRIEARLSAFRENHDISIFRDFPFVMLKEGDRIRTITDQVFKTAHIKPLIKFETNNTQTAMALAAEGIGIAVCPELYLNSNYVASGTAGSYIRKLVEVCPLFDDSLSDTIAIGYNKDRYCGKIAESFIRLCLDKMHGAERSVTAQPLQY
ncbi:MAG: LysR family transcriptional regulator [Clostridia bacterium]|nr:LysR family transcriptional regulator [Clostridia bacterium]